MEHANVNDINMSIVELVRQLNFSSYRVDIDIQAIHVVVTHNPDIVNLWISMLAFSTHAARQNLVVGVYAEWTRNEGMSGQRNRYEKLDVLQLCIGEHCLVYQIGHANGDIPGELLRFLGDRSVTFVGIGIYRIDEILHRDYRISFFRRIVDLNLLFETRRMERNHYGLRGLMNSVLRKDYVRTEEIKMGRWDGLVLSRDQILFACANAYFCSLIGIELEAWAVQIVARN